MKIFHINTLLTFICFNYLVNAQNPNFLWAKQFGASSYDIGQSIAVDDSGNVFTLGNFDGTVDFDPGPGIFNLTSSNGASFVSKLDASGNFIWVKQTGGSAFKVDGNGDVYITGGFNGTVDLDPGPGIYNLNPVGDGDMFISKLDASGNFIWARQIGGANSVVGSNAISFDTNGNIYTIGGFNGTVDFDPSPDIFNLISTNNGDAFISKLDASGNFIWAKQLGGTNSVGISSISLDAIGNVYTTGSFIFTSDFDPGPATYNLTGSNNGSAFVLKLDMSGDFVWAKLLGETPYHQFLSGGSTSNSIYVDHLSNVYTTGSFSWIADFDPGPGTFYLDGYFGINNTFISKLDASGNFVWAKLLAKGTSTSQAGSVNVDASGNVYTTGTFLGAPDFDPGPGNYNLTTNGLYDIFMSKLDSDGNFLWALQFGESNNDSGGSILDPSGNIYTTGYFSGTVDFNPSEETYNLSSAGIYDIFVLKLSSLNPCTAVSISTQPYNQSATVGGIATFNIIGDGTSPFTYQWKKNGINIPNANNASYTTPILTMTDNGNLYICVVMNCNGTNSITSNNALLTVCARPTQQASKIKFSPTCINPIKVSWSNGNGVRRVVKINTNNNFTAPLYGTDPVANPVYSGSGEQVIYNGTSNTVNLTINRSNINSFWIRVYEANCDGTFSYYNSLPSTDNPINIKTEDLLKLSFYETPACQNKQNGTATVEVFGGKGKQYSYLWSNTPPSRTKTAKNLAQGVYSVTVSSSTGCIAEGMTTVPSNPEIKVTAKVSTNNDPPFTVQINASGGIPGYTYRIGTSSGNYPNNSQNFPFFDNLTEGIYFFEVKDALGCTAEISVVVGKKGDCPYPIIFIHGFSGDETTWDAVYDKNEFKHIWGALADVLHTVNNAYDYTKVDGTNNVFENVNDDVLLGLHTFKKGCLYAVNMKNWWNEDPNNPQIEKHSSNPQNGQSESNESAILKSGYVIKNAINEVLKANSGKSKVILFCHSMGVRGS
ncbi:MAG: SBBP repeat-containing protein [Saprospiraceae bacterium]|nr:SBBP repeat-containing protein [Candidatus Vicinibacter affinis]